MHASKETGRQGGWRPVVDVGVVLPLPLRLVIVLLLLLLGGLFFSDLLVEDSQRLLLHDGEAPLGEGVRPGCRPSEEPVVVLEVVVHEVSVLALCTHDVYRGRAIFLQPEIELLGARDVVVVMITAHTRISIQLQGTSKQRL